MYQFSSEIANMNYNNTMCMDMCMCFRLAFQEVYKI